MLSPRALPKRLFVWLAGSLSRKRREGDDLPLTRLSYSRNWLVNVDGELRFRPTAFMPYRPKGRKLQLSVFRIDDLTDRATWEHVAKHARRPGRNIHGRADFRLGDVDSSVLGLVLDETPPRHGNVVGWPQDKDGQLALAQEFSEVAPAFRAPRTGVAA